MNQFPRLALATHATGPEPAPAVLALLTAFNSQSVHVQHFGARARPTADVLIAGASGLPGRRLDAWLMKPDTLLELFLKGATACDLSVVEGTLDDDPPPVDLRNPERPGRLEPIAEILDLPRVAVLSIPAGTPFHLPPLPRDYQAIILDGLDDPEDFGSFRRVIESLTKRPVLGAVERLPVAREALRSGCLARAVKGMAALGTSFLRFSDLAAIRTLAESRPLAECSDASPVWRTPTRFRVAYAQDAAFGGYFPDTLEMLESLGAEVHEFSPLRDEALPECVDLVLIGCGRPDLHACELAANLSMITALRSHVCHGRRIYSEGGGTAYLARSLRIGGRSIPMAGIFPVDATFRPDSPAPTPVSRTLLRPGWLGPRGTSVRGYRSNRWRLTPAPEPDDCPVRSGPMTAQGDIYFRHHAVGSLIHLHLASLPEAVAAFAAPVRALRTFA